MRIQNLNHIAIIVNNLETSRSFYKDVLRLSEMPRPNFNFPGAWFRLGDMQELHLIEGPLEKSRDNISRRNHFALQIDDAHAWKNHLMQTDTVFRGPKQRPDGAYQIFLLDPDGHQIELYMA